MMASSFVTRKKLYLSTTTQRPRIRITLPTTWTGQELDTSFGAFFLKMKLTKNTKLNRQSKNFANLVQQSIFCPVLSGQHNLTCHTLHNVPVFGDCNI